RAAVTLTRNPDRPLTDCDLEGQVAHGDDSSGATRGRIDPTNRVVLLLRDPDRAEADCDRVCEPPDRNASRATSPRIDTKQGVGGRAERDPGGAVAERDRVPKLEVSELVRPLPPKRVKAPAFDHAGLPGNRRNPERAAADRETRRPGAYWKRY